MAASIRLHRALAQKMWDTYPVTCRQLPGIGKLLGEKLLDSGLGGIAELAIANPRVIERSTNKVRHIDGRLILVHEAWRAVPTTYAIICDS